MSADRRAPKATPRVQSGTPAGGQFDHRSRPEADISLTEPEDSAPVGPDTTADPATRDKRSGLPAALFATHEELWSHVDDPDISQRIAATSNVRVDAYQLGALADHAQPVIVRRAVARLLRPGIAECAAADPSPAVRQMALGGWDLPDAVRQRLMADPAVLLARLLLSYPGPQTEVSA